MLTTLKPTVITDSTLIGLEVEQADGREGVDGKAAPNNLLKLVKFSPVFYIFVFSKKNTASLWKEMWETKTVGLTNKTQA